MRSSFRCPSQPLRTAIKRFPLVFRIAHPLEDAEPWPDQGSVRRLTLGLVVAFEFGHPCARFLFPHWSLKMNVAEEISTHRGDIIAALLRVAPRAPGVGEAEAEQMVAGYVYLLEQAAAGNPAPRDEYLATVIPGVKQAGMPLGYIARVLVTLDLALAPLVSEQNRAWITEYCADYADRLVQAWEKS